MKVFSSEYDFDYSWDEVSTANWLKYCPWNKESTHVIAVDTLSRRVDPATGILRTERLITCRQGAPKWLAPFLGSNEMSHVYEVSYVQPAPSTSPSAAPETSSAIANASNASALSQQSRPQQPTIRMISENMTWSDLLSVRETVTYRPSPSDPEHKTHFEQEARVTALCGGWQRLRERIEGFTVERFGQNAQRGRRGFEEVLEMSRRVFGEERERAKAGSA